jgi:hypothetical protein
LREREREGKVEKRGWKGGKVGGHARTCVPKEEDKINRGLVVAYIMG